MDAPSTVSLARDPGSLHAPDLLAWYQLADFFLQTPQRRLLAKGIASRVPAAPLAHLPAVLARHLQEEGARLRSVPIAVGAIGFGDETPAALVVPLEVAETRSVRPRSTKVLTTAAPLSGRMRADPCAAAYVDAVCRAVGRLRAFAGSGDLRKVVLARALEIEAQAAIDPRRVLADLAARNPAHYVFAADLPRVSSDGAGPRAVHRTLIGASPELLLSRWGSIITSNPLAGSAARSVDPGEDRARAAALMTSVKDRHEHALVTEAVQQALAPFCRTLIVPAAPSLMQTPTMWHLSTTITGELCDPGTTALALAVALHPTPAVCGSPREPARDLIAQLELTSRGYYSGLLGWCDGRGDGEWIISLRCAEVEGRRARLYAGAGIVADSIAQNELNETSAKFRTMLNALAIVTNGEDLS